MYDIKWIRDNAAAFDAGRAHRGLGPLSAELLALDDVRRAAIVQNQAAQERRNAASKEIGQAMAQKDMARAEALKAEVAELKARTADFEAQEREAVAALTRALSEIPNTPLADVPVGADEHGNVVKSVWGEIPAFAFPPKEHFDIGEGLGMMDFDAAAKISGARFVVNKGPLARLERALGQFMLDLHTQENGYTEVNPPVLVKDDAMYGTAQLPKFADDLFAASRKFTGEEPLTDNDANDIVNVLATADKNFGGLIAGMKPQYVEEEFQKIRNKIAQRNSLWQPPKVSYLPIMLLWNSSSSYRLIPILRSARRTSKVYSCNLSTPIHRKFIIWHLE